MLRWRILLIFEAFGRLRVQEGRAEMRLMAEQHRGTEEALLAHGGLEMLQQTTQDPGSGIRLLPRKTSLGRGLTPDRWTPVVTVLGDSVRSRRDSERARAGVLSVAGGHVTGDAVAGGKRCRESRDTMGAVLLKLVPRQSAGERGRFWEILAFRRADARALFGVWCQRSGPSGPSGPELGARATLTNTGSTSGSVTLPKLIAL